MWSGEQLTEALDVCDATGAPRPVAAQMSCSLAEHRQASDPTIGAALDRGPIGLVAAHVLAGGTLSGKYLDDPNRPGRAANDDNPLARRGKEIATRLAELGGEWGHADGPPGDRLRPRPPATWRSILFGATSPEQVRNNVAAVATFDALDNDQRAAIDDLA